jgi:addiction module HigA family antidote
MISRSAGIGGREFAWTFHFDARARARASFGESLVPHWTFSASSKLSVHYRNCPKRSVTSTLRELCLPPLGVTVTDAARALRVSRTTLSEIVNGHARISPEMAIRLAIAFDTTP